MKVSDTQEFISKVIRSCQNYEQAYHCLKWLTRISRQTRNQDNASLVMFNSALKECYDLFEFYSK